MSIRTRAALVASLVAVLVLPAVPVGASSAAAASAQAPVVSHLQTDSLNAPLGVDGSTPRLSWQVDAPRRGMSQSRYAIHVASTPARLTAPDVWNSDTVASTQSVDVLYGGPALTSHTQYYWSVKVWDDAGVESAWSPASSFETGLLSAGDWTSDWIGANSATGPEWTDYTVKLDFTLKKDAFGVFFRSTSGLGYMWQINEETAGRPLFRPHVRLPGGGYALLGEVPLNVDLAQRHTLAISVVGTTITTTIDGAQIDQRTRTDYNAPGVVGLRTSGAENAIIHSFSVVNTAGRTLVDTAFPAGDDTFDGGAILAGGGLQISGGDIWLTGKNTPVLRKDLQVPSTKEISNARIYAAAQGVYELRLNGQKVGDQELAPGWTDYTKRIQDQTYDVTALLKPGANTLGAELTNGWFAGNVAMFGGNKYGTATSLIAQLRISYTDGSSDVIGTDSSWKSAPGPIKTADLLNGENYDARRATAIAGWDKPGFDDTGWDPTVVRTSATSRLEPQTDQPVRVTGERAATALSSPTPQTYLYDLGQNMVGKARFTLTGTPGQKVKFRYGEVLNPDGSLYTANLRGAKATDYYTFASSSPETYAPTFTFHGFRYIEITGLDSAPPASAVTGVVMGTDGAPTSSFETSSALVNQLHSNIVWGQRGNFLSIPTDTPARDERMGWTGDINVFARTAVYNMDSQAFLSKWLQDLRDTQRSDGAYASVAPVVPATFDGGYGNAGWADAGVNVPWTLWQAYGDTKVIKDNYASMSKYVDYLVATSTGLIRGGGDYGDWLNLDDPTPGDLIGTSFIAKDSRQLSQMAAAIGDTAGAAKYQKLYDDVRQAFATKFVAADGTVSGDSQTAYILAITSDLVPASQLKAAGEHFANTITRKNTHLSTGFLGVDGLLPVLSKIGRTDLAYALLQNTDYPSWGYEIAKGATTVWERWNSIGVDGKFGDVGMNSFNHYAYGAVGQWMYSTLAGVSALEPGYKSSLIAPEPGSGITFASYSHDTRYGRITSSWKQAQTGLSLSVVVPGNTTAEVRLPADNVYAIAEGGKALADVEGIRSVVDDGQTVTVTVGSGHYDFLVDPRRSAVGVAFEGVDQLSTSAATLADKGQISQQQGGHLGDAATDVNADLRRAIDALGTTGAAAANHVAHALRTALALGSWISAEISDPAARTSLQASNDSVVSALSEAIRTITGLTASVTVGPGVHLAGQDVPVVVTVTNTGGQNRPGAVVELTAPSGWQVKADGGAHAVPARGSADFPFTVTVPDTAILGPTALLALTTFTVDAVPVQFPAAGSLAVASPLTIISAGSDPVSGEPGALATVKVVVHNQSARAVVGHLSVGGPDGWALPQPSADVTIQGGQDAVLSAPVRIPLEGNAAPVELTAVVADAHQTLASTVVPFTFTQTLTPTDAIDYADLGDAAAETAHKVTAAPSSGTSVEAGRTRRYSGMFVPGSWFEFDLGITAGKPFLMRVVETYDGPQVKDYTLLVNGKAVHHRLISHQTAGGLETFQFLVDDPTLLDASTVRVRAQFNDTAAGYDPSIADVWSLPVPSQP